MRNLVNEVSALSFTTDIWTSSVCPMSLLQQDVQTCWNSTFDMILSLIEQKRALGIFMSEYGLPDTLTAHQWMLLEKYKYHNISPKN